LSPAARSAVLRALLLLGATTCAAPPSPSASPGRPKPLDRGCTSDAACPDPGEPCRASACIDGFCSFVPRYVIVQPLFEQVPHDCRMRACDPEGHEVSLPDDDDTPIGRGPECTVPRCRDGARVDVHRGGLGCARGGICYAGGCVHVRSFEGGTRRGLALLDDGSMIEWGAPIYVPPPPDTRDIVSVARGGLHECGLRSDGLVICWGDDADAQRGFPSPDPDPQSDGARDNPPELAPVAGIHDAVAVSAGLMHSCAIRRGDRVSCWGRVFGDDRAPGNPRRGTSVTFPSKGVEEIVAARFFSCARSSDGHVSCWGDNAEGQLGDGTRARRLSPVRVRGLDDAAQIAAGGAQACALRKNGAVACWGEGWKGLVQIEGFPRVVTRLAVDDIAACALLDDGRVACFRNDASPLAKTHVVPEVEGVVELHASGMELCARTDEGPILCWSETPTGRSEPDESKPSPLRLTDG
jgi:alpha-tubulin suppressor-like RCC1 family protein